MKAYEIDLKKLKRYAIKDRLNKVSVRQFARRTYEEGN